MTGHEHGHQHGERSAQADLLDLDAEVFAPAVAAVHDEIGRLAGAPIRTILDLGAGTGAGTFALLQRFADAQAVAVDASPDMLARITSRAEALGLADRVRTLLADLDDGAPPVDPVDLVWASASLHHLADPVASLARLAEVVRPGGLLVVLEVDGIPRFVPDGTPGAETEARAHALLTADRAMDMPSMGGDWGPLLHAAGLAVESSHDVAVAPGAVAPSLLATYAAAALARVRDATAGRLEAGDVLALDALVDGGPQDVRHRDDLQAAGDRRVWVARRS
jgi:SAM-dependent methyltransferase